MNDETVRKWIQKAENDLKIGKNEMATQNPVTDGLLPYAAVCGEVSQGLLDLSWQRVPENPSARCFDKSLLSYKPGVSKSDDVGG
jgi:hypothetical protein